MKSKLWRILFALLILATAGISFCQTPVAKGPTTSYSSNGYPRLDLPGSNHIAYTQVFGQVDPVTAWSWNGVTGSGSVVTYTATNTLAAGDYVNIWLIDTTVTPNSKLPRGYLAVASATSTTFTINGNSSLASGDATSGTLVVGEVQQLL